MTFAGPWMPHTAYSQRTVIRWSDGTLGTALTNHVSADKPDSDYWGSLPSDTATRLDSQPLKAMTTDAALNPQEL